LQVKPPVVKDTGIIQLFVQLQVDAFRAFQQAQTGQQFLIKMGFEIGQLGLFNAGYFFQYLLFVIVFGLVDGVEKLDDLEVLAGRTPLYIELEMPFFCLFQGFYELNNMSVERLDIINKFGCNSVQ